MSIATRTVLTCDRQSPDAGPAHPDALLLRLGDLAPGDTGRVSIRARVIESYLPMAVHVARRFAGRGEPLADLEQVAVIAMIKAVDRFDTHREVPFASYAIPTMAGELKRHFRDTTWNARVPRRLQELALRLGTATEELAQLLQRSPTTSEMADRLGVTARDVTQARGAISIYRPVPVQQTASGHDDLYVIDLLPVTDHAIEAIDNRETLRVLLADLPARERLILHLRFYSDMTQSQIATEIGTSQMHVSRLLTRSLTRLRDGMLAETGSANARTGPANGTPRSTTRRRGSADAGRSTARRHQS